MNEVEFSFGRLPSPPLLAHRLLDITSKTTIDRHALCKIVSVGPMFAVRIMKLANSPSYNNGTLATNIPQAVSRIGVNATATLALGFNAPQNVPDCDETGLFPFKLYWQHSYAMGVCCRLISKLARQPFFDASFLCGLLARIGQPMMASSCNKKYGQVIMQAESSLPDASLESSVFGYDHHQIGSQVLTEWGLPELICGGIRHYGNPKLARECTNNDLYPLCTIMQVADQIAGNFQNFEDTALTNRIQAVFRSRWNLTLDQTNQFVTDLKQATQEMYPLFDKETIDPDESTKIYQRAQKQMAIIATRTNTNLHEHSIQHGMLKNEFVALKTEMSGLGHQGQKLKKNFQLLTHSAIASSVVAGVAFIAIFLVVYFVKSVLGINLLDNLHLEDLLFK